MPEDYQTILDDLGVDTSGESTPAQPEGNQEPAEATPQTGDTGADVNTDPQPQDDGATPDDNGSADAEEQRRNEAFAAMRSENSKYKKFIQHIMKGSNFQGDEAAFMEALTDASYARQAKAQGGQVNPEILKRMDNLENQNRTLIESQNRQMFATNLKGLQETFKLKDSELKEFVDLAVKEKIDLTIPGTNFVTLYQGLFFNKIKDKLIEEERQKWIEQNSKSNNAANPDGKSGKKDPSPTNVNTMAEFDSLLQSIPSNK